MMTDEERKIYMSLSNDQNERGRLWKKMKIKHSKLAEEMMEYYDKIIMEEALKYKDIICKTKR